MSKVLGEVLAVNQFLRLPETKPALEFVGGRVVQKVSPKSRHSVIQTKLASRIEVFAVPRRLGQPYVELRCTFGGLSLVPDIAFIAQGRIPHDSTGKIVDDVMLAPDLAIEILSQGQTVKELTEKLKLSLKKGVRLGWLFQPTKEQVLVFRPGARPQSLGRGDTLSGEDVLPGFTLPVAAVYDWLTEG
ncbi:MAG TPA: Uma2 family endonuclease [Isosphaeraceae bacterium]|jgi:Uma2 family endonuclease|nr:Uma2 family endonuclease [Isosphaeraceae bacterium]